MKTYKSNRLGEVTVPDSSISNDFEDPVYMFQTTATSLLTQIVKECIDPVLLAKMELANRGMDENGLWVGFDNAHEIHNV